MFTDKVLVLLWLLSNAWQCSESNIMEIMRVWIILARPNKTNSNRIFVLEVWLFWKKKTSQFYFCLSWCLIVHPYWGWRLWRTNEIRFYPKRTNGWGWRQMWDTASDPAHTQFLTEASTLSSISVGRSFFYSCSLSSLLKHFLILCAMLELVHYGPNMQLQQ